MIKDMTLYICPDCKVLLMRPEKRQRAKETHSLKQ